MGEADPISRLNAALEGRYRIERELGAGGMATVYLAEDVRHRRNVALKVLKPELAAVVGNERFLAEIQTTANLQHPHILPLFDSGEADGFLFYVMPYVEGESLRQRLDREHQLPVDEAVAISSKVASALDYAHRHGVIHRDIKPGNVLLSETGEPLVSDFGIALALSAGGGDRLTETGLSLGTPHYMSPEQATGDLNLGPWTDIWALGCVLYETLVGEPPFTGSTPQAVLGRIIIADAPTAGAERKAVSPNVDAAIGKALERVPADRFAAADEFARALGDGGFRHGSDGIRPLDSSPNSKRLAVGAAVLTGALVAVLVMAVKESPSNTRGAISLSMMVDTPGLTLSLTPPAVSPDGMSVAFGVMAQDGTAQLHVRRLDKFTSTVVSDRGNTFPVFSPDGQWVAFRTTIGQVLRTRVDGGSVRALCQCPATRGMAWTSDDRIVYTSLAERNLWQVSASGGDPTPLTVLDTVAGEAEHVWPQALPDGRLLYGVRYSTEEDDEIRILSGDDSQTVHEGASRARYVEGRLLFEAEGSFAFFEFDPDRGTAEGQPMQVLDDIGEIRRFGAVDEAMWGVGADGTLTYVPGNLAEGARPLIEVSREGRAEVLLPAVDLAPVYPRVSPDGTRLLFEDGGNLWTLELGSQRVNQLTFDGSNETAVWGPDGTVVYQSNGPGPPGIFALSADGRGEPIQIIEGIRRWPAAVTSDGTTLVFDTYGEETFGDFGMMRLTEPADPIPLLQDEFETWTGGPSPDGRWLVYVSNQTGRYEVYVTEFPSGVGRWRVSTDGGTEAAWSPRGDELFYRSGDRMMVVGVLPAEPGREFRWETARELFRGPYSQGAPGIAGYGVALDAATFYMTQEGGTQQIRVLRGWGERTDR